MSERLAAHVAAFNDAVRAAEWEGFAQRFADDARMTFVGVPVGPFLGRAAIAAAYRDNPPADTMTLTSPDGAFRWDHGGSGRMRIVFDAAGLVTSLEISFD